MDELGQAAGKPQSHSKVETQAQARAQAPVQVGPGGQGKDVKGTSMQATKSAATAPVMVPTTPNAKTNATNNTDTPSPSFVPAPSAITTSPGSISNSVANPKRSPDRDEPHDAEPKRRRVMRACDVCRRRKIRCDGPSSTPGIRVGDDAKCTHCRENHLQCTYVNEPSRKAARPGLVTALQERSQRLELLLQQLLPGFDTAEFVGPAIDSDTFDEDAHREALRLSRIPPLPEIKSISGYRGSVLSGSAPRRASTSALSRPTVLPFLSADLTPAVPTAPLAYAGWLQTDVLSTGNTDLYSGIGQVRGGPEQPQYCGRRATQNLIYTLNGGDLSFANELDRVRRPRIWKEPEWESAVVNETQGAVDHSIWPEDEQAAVLFDAYFANVNSIFPLLHSQLFRRQYFQQRHYIGDNAFARVCLMVFANGSRFASTAQFTQWQGSSDRFSAGWKYLRAFMTSQTGLHETPSLCSLQAAALLGFFLRGNASPTIIWAVAGGALRSAQELGVHVRLPTPPTLAERQERELFARAFWCLYHLDRSMCVILGRALAIPDTEVFAEPPHAVDDASWDDEMFLTQTTGTPSDLDAFIHMLDLDRIISTAIEAIPAGATETPGAAGAKERLSLSAPMINLVTALNRWIRSLPAHLQWNDSAKSLPEESFIRLAHLHARYHWAVIAVHYGGVAAGEWSPELSLDSSLQSAQSIFAICDSLLQHPMYAPSAAQGGAAQRPIPFEFIDYAGLAAAVTLWAINTGALPATKYDSSMAGINKCVATLLQIECVSRKSGQFADILSVMARNVANQVQAQQMYTPNALGKASTTTTPVQINHPMSDTSLASGGTPYSQSGVHSIPSVPSASFSTPAPGPAPSLLQPEQQSGLHSPTEFPWLISPQYGDMSQQQPQHQSMYHTPNTATYSTDPAAVASAGAGPAAMGQPPVLSIQILPGDSSTYVPTQQTPGSAGASGSAPNISPIEPLPMPMPLPQQPTMSSHEQCSRDGQWPHLMSFAAGFQQPQHHQHHQQRMYPQQRPHPHAYSLPPSMPHLHYHTHSHPNAHMHAHAHQQHAEHRHAQALPNPSAELAPELHLQLQDPNSGGPYTHHP